MIARAEATSLAGFIQQLAVCLVGRGYWFYVLGTVPAGKDPTTIDAKLVHRYRADASKWARLRRKRAGLANVSYLRLGRTFVLVATHGLGEFFDEEGAAVRDARREPIKVGGYAVGYRGGHVSVRIDLARYRQLKAYLLEIACRRDARGAGRRGRPGAGVRAVRRGAEPGGVPAAGGQPVAGRGRAGAGAQDLPADPAAGRPPVRAGRRRRRHRGRAGRPGAVSARFARSIA